MQHPQTCTLQLCHGLSTNMHPSAVSWIIHIYKPFSCVMDHPHIWTLQLCHGSSTYINPSAMSWISDKYTTFSCAMEHEQIVTTGGSTHWMALAAGRCPKEEKTSFSCSFITCVSLQSKTRVRVNTSTLPSSIHAKPHGHTVVSFSRAKHACWHMCSPIPNPCLFQVFNPFGAIVKKSWHPGLALMLTFLDRQYKGAN